jgi:hypothetical protein
MTSFDLKLPHVEFVCYMLILFIHFYLIFYQLFIFFFDMCLFFVHSQASELMSIPHATRLSDLSSVALQKFPNHSSATVP